MDYKCSKEDSKTNKRSPILEGKSEASLPAPDAVNGSFRSAILTLGARLVGRAGPTSPPKAEQTDTSAWKEEGEDEGEGEDEEETLSLYTITLKQKRKIVAYCASSKKKIILLSLNFIHAVVCTIL